MDRRRRWAVLGGLAVAVSLGMAGMAGAQSGPELDLDDPPEELCSAVFTARAFDGFLPEDEAAGGDRVRVTVEWQSSNVDADRVDILGCVAVDGEPAGGLATMGRKVKNDGKHHLSFLLPDDLRAGAKVCERSAVIGSGADISRTPATCWSVAAATAGEEAAAPAPVEAGPRPQADVAGPQIPAGPGPVVAGAVEERGGAVALPRTGSGSRPLGALAGAALGLGGLAVALGAPGARKVGS